MSKPSSICTACGTYFPEALPLPACCPICRDDRQFIAPYGQQWTSQERLGQQHAVLIKPIREGLYSLKMTPSFAIGQRAFLYCSEQGNLLWDCIPLLDQSTVAFIRGLGGLSGMVISHPHYYSQMNLWAEAFDCPIYIHEADADWIMDKGPRIQLWKGNALALNDATVYNLGGHFPGSAVMQVPGRADGTLFCGDTLYIAPSKRFVAVSHSYPNHIPLKGKAVRGIFEQLETIPFDTAYGAFEFQNLEGNAREIIRDSAQRYQEAYDW
jgi:hypothetical protein